MEIRPVARDDGDVEPFSAGHFCQFRKNGCLGSTRRKRFLEVFTYALREAFGKITPETDLKILESVALAVERLHVVEG